MKDNEFIERAENILHNLSLERIGWKKFIKRWYNNHEPLRVDAAELMRESGRSGLMPMNAKYTGENN